MPPQSPLVQLQPHHLLDLRMWLCVAVYVLVRARYDPFAPGAAATGYGLGSLDLSTDLYSMSGFGAGFGGLDPAASYTANYGSGAGGYGGYGGYGLGTGVGAGVVGTSYDYGSGLNLGSNYGLGSNVGGVGAAGTGGGMGLYDPYVEAGCAWRCLRGCGCGCGCSAVRQCG